MTPVEASQAVPVEEVIVWSALIDPAHARRIADAAIEAGFDMAYDKPLRAFFYLPFMHSEALADQERCVKLTAERARESTRDYAVIHCDIIARFGRFPHRNPVLGRVSTPEELAFLKAGGFAG